MTDDGLERFEANGAELPPPAQQGQIVHDGARI
jgi:hypothetical protein